MISTQVHSALGADKGKTDQFASTQPRSFEPTAEKAVLVAKQPEPVSCLEVHLEVHDEEACQLAAKDVSAKPSRRLDVRSRLNWCAPEIGMRCAQIVEL